MPAQASPRQLDALAERAGAHDVTTMWSEAQFIVALSPNARVLLYLLGTFPTRHETLATLAGGVTAGKTILITFSLLSAELMALLIALSRGAYRLGLRNCHL